jgi:hypothetical protein
MNIEKIAYQTGVDAPSANLKLFADLIIKNYHDENYQVRTDNTQLIANMEAKIAELELHKCNKCHISVGGNKALNKIKGE